MFKRNHTIESKLIFIKETCERVFKTRYQIYDEDVIADTVASVILQYKKSSRQIKSLEGWVVGAIHYHYISYVKRKQKENQFTYDELILENLSEDEYPQTKHDTDEIYAEIEKLGDPYRDIIKLRIIDGLSYKDIAKKLQLNVATTRKYFERGIIRVKHALNIISIFLGVGMNHA